MKVFNTFFNSKGKGTTKRKRKNDGHLMRKIIIKPPLFPNFTFSSFLIYFERFKKL